MTGSSTVLELKQVVTIKSKEENKIMDKIEFLKTVLLVFILQIKLR